MQALIPFIALITGVILGWLAKAQISRAEAKASELAVDHMKETFQSLASDSLLKNNQQFLDLAKSNFEKIHVSADKDLKNRQQAVEGFVNNLQQNLNRYEKLVHSFEQDRGKQYGSLKEQLSHLIQAEKDLRQTTHTLETALKDSKARGNWGELQLKRVIEMAGLKEHVDFSTQSSYNHEDGQIRPDVIVKMPDVRNIAIDAKAPLANYLKATASQHKDDKARYLKVFHADIRKHINDLGSKAYFDKVENSAPFVVMFLPGEALIRAAMELDVTLLDQALSKKVIIASPSTLLAILLIVEKSWKDSKVSTHLEAVKKEGHELIKRLETFLGHLDKVGKGISSAANAFNSLAGSWNRNLLPQTNKFNKLRGHNKPIPNLVESKVPETRDFIAIPKESIEN
ncbi:DNA recombination protein RmuC [bacterium]|jgi:DNA recombination protein RmuC|nr:DNA recombination protein RmuC [bacterium]